jgi:2,4-diaminopentanoate dehydrogenase
MARFHRGASMPVRVLHVGLGPIGAGIVRQVAVRRGLRIVGAVDIDPAKFGRDVGEVVGLDRKLRVTVDADLRAALKRTGPDVVLLCTSSALKVVAPQIDTILKARKPIVSTTEELAFPWYSQRRLAGTIDVAAKRAKVAVLGTGVNPGFVMDALPVTLTGVCERVDRITVNRIQDARIRRLPFQQKIGSGLTRQQFAERVQERTVRHVGLTESIAMIAAAMGWTLNRVTDEIQPKIAEARVSSEFLTVEAGLVCGIIQDGMGYVAGEPIIRLHMEAYLGAPESYDSTEIEGIPNLSMKIAGGVHGDIATTSIAVNSIPRVLEAPPGLHTMRSLPIPSWFNRTAPPT